MKKGIKEYFFLIDLAKTKNTSSNEIEFTQTKNKPLCIFSKEYEDKLIMVFLLRGEIFKKLVLEFSYDNKVYNIILKPKYESFIFKTNLKLKEESDLKIPQKLNLTQIVNYFFEALEKYDGPKSDAFFHDLIALYKDNPDYNLLINIFVKIYRTNFCQELLYVFNNNSKRLTQEKYIIQEGLEEHKDLFEHIYFMWKSNHFDDVNIIYCYGLILSYFINYSPEIFESIVNGLYMEKHYEILFEVLLTYRIYFLKKTNLKEEILVTMIQYAIRDKSSSELKIALPYLNDIKDIKIFFNIIRKIKEEITEIKDFEPIATPSIEHEKDLDIYDLLKIIDEILAFSKYKKILLINFNRSFWNMVANKLSELKNKMIEDVYYCCEMQERLKKYYILVEELIPNENDKIRKEIKSIYKKDLFLQQINKKVKNYIQDNQKIGGGGGIKDIYESDISNSESKIINLKQPKNESKFVEKIIDNSNENNNLDIKIEEKILILTNDAKNAITLHFQSCDQTLNYAVTCKIRERFSVIVGEILDREPKFQENDFYCLCNGSKIKEHQTIQENRLKDGDRIIIQTVQ